MNNLRIVYKLVSQYFNLDNYMSADDPPLESASLQTAQVDLVASGSVSHKYALTQNNVQVYDNKFIDLSQLPFFEGL